jgi:hypothetical protein
MYIAKSYLETKFNKIFKKGDVVPDEIAEHYLNNVTKVSDDELLVETPSDVEIIVKDDNELDDEKETITEEKKPKKKKKGFF